jgi:hypothetical protein
LRLGCLESPQRRPAFAFTLDEAGFFKPPQTYEKRSDFAAQRFVNGHVTAEFQHFPNHGFCGHRPVLGKDFANYYQPRAAQFILAGFDHPGAEGVTGICAGASRPLG